MQNKQNTCLFTCMYAQFGTEEDEKKEKKRMARILRVWNTEYDIVQPAHVRPKQVL